MNSETNKEELKSTSKLFITVKSDTNDADYVEKTSEISEEELAKIKPLIEKIKEYSKANPDKNNFPWGYWSYPKMGDARDIYDIDDDLEEIIDNIMPSDPADVGTHSIKSIIVRCVVSETNIFDKGQF